MSACGCLLFLVSLMCESPTAPGQWPGAEQTQSTHGRAPVGAAALSVYAPDGVNLCADRIHYRQLKWTAR